MVLNGDLVANLGFPSFLILMIWLNYRVKVGVITRLCLLDFILKSFLFLFILFLIFFVDGL